MRGRLNLLLDTHILIWWLADHKLLTKRARTAIEDADVAWVSSISAWEMEIKRVRGRLDSPSNLEETLKARDLRSLPMTMAHAITAARLPPHHRDPFDRMLIAQATVESLVVLTADPLFAAYDVPMIVA